MHQHEVMRSHTGQRGAPVDEVRNAGAYEGAARQNKFDMQVSSPRQRSIAPTAARLRRPERQLLPRQ